MSSTDNIKVAIKARPLIEREIIEGLQPLWNIKRNSVYQTDESGSRYGELYTFDHVFDELCTNTNVYTTVVHPLVEAFMEGFNATIFTYGQTSSGKTHTMLGSKTEDGLFHLVVKDIFHHVAAKVDKKYLIRCSYFEIYNEKINDLLEKSNQALSIREDTKGNMLLNAREAVVTDVAEVLGIMKQGNKLRRIGATCMNDRSSRSHTIFRIILESKDSKEEDPPVHVSQLNLVDLAGSERIAQSKAAGERLKEGVNINKSLSALGNVIRQLSEGRQQFVNYRDSKLTRLLTQALGGNAKSLIIANITLVAGEETKSTLEFAQRAKNVKNKPEVNILSSRDEAIQQYQSMKQNLESRLKKQAEMLEEMERHKEECLIEIERLKLEATIVGHFQSGASATKSQKPSRRHTIGDYGASSSEQRPSYKPLKHFSQGGTSPGREMKTIHEDSFEEALAEAESITFEEVPVRVLQRQLKSLEQSYTELREFTKLEKQCCYEELTELRENAHAANLEISRLNEELEQAKQRLDEQTKQASNISEKAQDYVDLQYKFEFMEEKYKKTLTSYEHEIESLRNQLEDPGQVASAQDKHEIPALEAKNIELTARVSQLEAIIHSEIEENKDTLSKLNILKNILTETFDVQGAETQTEETVKSLEEMEEELEFREALVAKLKDDIKQLKDQNTEQQLKYTFEISEIRSDNQTTANELLEQNAQLEEQNEILSTRIIEEEDEIDRLQIELEIKKKEMAGMRRLYIRTATAATEPDPLLSEDDVEFYKQEVEFMRNFYKNLMDQMEEGIEKLKVDHQQVINQHIKIESDLTQEKTKAEEKCKDYVEDIRELQKQIECLQSHIDVMNELLLVEHEQDVVGLINAHMEKKRNYEEELLKVSQQYTEEFNGFMDAFVNSLREFRDSAKEEDKELLEGYVALFSDESRDRFLTLTNFLDQTRGFSDPRYKKHIHKLRCMGNYWVYQDRTTRERELRGNIHREYNNLEYLRKMRYNLDYKSDSSAMIQSLEELLEESRRQHNFEIAKYENQIQELLSKNEKLRLEDQTERLAHQIELLEKKLVESGDMELLKVTVENLELENESLKDILEKLRQQVAHLEPVNTKVEELTLENETLKNHLREYERSVADLPEITNERDMLQKHADDLKKELENLQIENDSMRMKMLYMKDTNEENNKKINIYSEVKKDLESQLNNMTDKYNSLSLENEGMITKIKILEDELKQRSDRVQTLEEINAKLKFDIEQSMKTCESMKQTGVKRDDQIRSMEVENERLKNLIAEKERTILKLNADSNAMYEEVDHLKDELAVQVRELNRVHCDIDIKLKEIEKLKSKIGEMTHDIVELRSTKSEVDELRAQLAKKSDETDSLRSQIANLMRKHKEADSKLDTMAKENRDLHRLNRQLQSDLEAKPFQEQPNILKETFRKHKKKIADLQSENASLREQIKSVQQQLDASDSKRVEAYQIRMQALEEDKMKLIRQVYDLERKIRESELETKPPFSSNIGSAPGTLLEAKASETNVSFKLKHVDASMQLTSPDLSPRELTKIKRHSLHDSRRGLTSAGEKEPVAGTSKEPEKRFTQEDWDKMRQKYMKELAGKEKQIDAMRSDDIVQKKHIDALEKEVKKLKKWVEPEGPADLMTSEPFRYDDKAALKRHITALEHKIERLLDNITQLEEVKREKIALQTVNEANNQQLEKLLAELTDSKNECSSSRQQLAAAKQEVKTLNDRLRMMQRTNEDFQSRILGVQAKLQSTETELRVKQQTIESLERDVARLNSRSTTPASLDSYQKQQNLEKRLKNSEERMVDLEKKYANLNSEKQTAEEDYKKSVEKLQYKIDKLKMLAQMRRKENLELRQLLGLGEEDLLPPPKK